MQDAEDRPAVLDETDVDSELAIPRDELAGPIERVDRPEARCRWRQAFGLDGLLGDDRNVREGLGQHGDDDPLCGEVGFGHRRLVGLLADVEGRGIDI